MANAGRGLEQAEAAGLLTGKPKNEATDQQVADLTAAQKATADQILRQRDHFFYFVCTAVAAVIVAGVGVIVAYLTSQWGKVEPSVVIAWFSAEIVQTIGLAYIVAKYLFSKDSEPKRPE